MIRDIIKEIYDVIRDKESIICEKQIDLELYLACIENINIYHRQLPYSVLLLSFPGRGIAYYGERILEFQTALALNVHNDYERREKIKEVLNRGVADAV